MSLSSLDMDDDLDKLLNLIIDILKENQLNKGYLQKNNDVLKELCLRQSKESEKLREAVDENNRQKEILQDLMLDDNPQLQKVEFENISLRAEIEALKASQERSKESPNEALKDTLKALQEKCDSLEGKLREVDTFKNSNSDREEKICALEKDQASLLEKTKCADNLQRENARLLEVVTENEVLSQTVTDLQDILTIRDKEIEDLQKKYQSLEENKKIRFNFQAENKVFEKDLSDCDHLKTDNLKLQALYDSEEPKEQDEAKILCDILRKQKYDLQEELTCKPGLRVRYRIHDDDTTNVREQSERETQRGSLADVGIEASNKDAGPKMTCIYKLNDFEQMLASAAEEDINFYSLGNNGNPDMDKRLSKTEDEDLLSLEANCDRPSVEDLRVEHDRTVAELRRARDVMLRSLKDIKGNLP